MRSLTSLVTQFTHQWPGEEVWTGMRSHGRRGIPTEMEIRTLHRTGTENIVTTMGSAFSLLHFHSQAIIFDYSQFFNARNTVLAIGLKQSLVCWLLNSVLMLDSYSRFLCVLEI